MSYFRFDMSVALASPYDDDGFIGVQIDALGLDHPGSPGSPDTGVVAYEMHAPGGLLHRPLDPGLDANGQPISSQSCAVLFALEGGQGHAWVMQDPRILINLPPLKQGETMLYGAFGQFVRLANDGSATIVVSDTGTMSPGRDIVFRVSPDGLLFDFPGIARFTIDKSGIVLNHKYGGRLGLEYSGGLPGPLSKLSSNASIAASQISLEAALIGLGSADGTDGAVQHTQFAALITELIGIVESLVAGLVAVPTGSPAAIISGAAFSTAASPAQTALAALLATLPETLAAMKSKTSSA